MNNHGCLGWNTQSITPATTRTRMLVNLQLPSPVASSTPQVNHWTSEVQQILQIKTLKIGKKKSWWPGIATHLLYQLIYGQVRILMEQSEDFVVDQNKPCRGRHLQTHHQNRRQKEGMSCGMPLLLCPLYDSCSNPRVNRIRKNLNTSENESVCNITDPTNT